MGLKEHEPIFSNDDIVVVIGATEAVQQTLPQDLQGFGLSPDRLYTFNRATEALAHITTRFIDREQPTLIFIEMDLPDANSLEILEAVRSYSEAIPVILLSSERVYEKPVENLVLGKGANGVLILPYTTSGLFDLLKRIRA